jgi:outer membrane protein OmpA-like peptidoglycan-associated protein
MFNSKATGAILTGAVASAGLWLSGCATQQYVDTRIAQTQAQFAASQQAQDQQIAQAQTMAQNASATANQAVATADQATKAAQGKFDYAVVLTDDAARFRSGSFALSDGAKSMLNNLAAQLRTSNQPVHLEIRGFADNTGSRNYNFRLGRERADAVRRYLSQQGVALNRMASISYGEEMPIAPNDTAQGRAQNRRVVVAVLQ